MLTQKQEHLFPVWLRHRSEAIGESLVTIGDSLGAIGDSFGAIGNSLVAIGDCLRKAVFTTPALTFCRAAVTRVTRWPFSSSIVEIVTGS